MTDVLGVLAAVALLLANAFFVGAEFAVISARRTQIEPLARAGSRRARMALRAMAQVSLMLAGAQLGITICSLLLGAVAEPAIAHLIEIPFLALGAPEALLHPIAFVIALSLVVYLHMVIGEMVPKNLALASPEAASLLLAPPLLAWAWLTRPVLVSLNWIANHTLRLFGIEPTDEVKTVYTADEFASLASESRSEGLLGEGEHERISGALTLTDKTAVDVLRPWSTVRTVTDDCTPAQVEELAISTQLSRFPMLDGGGGVLGFVHVKDTLDYVGSARAEPLPRSGLRPLSVVPPDTSLADLLVLMRRDRSHLVLVRDGGGPEGVITMDDVLAAVVGSRVGAS